jgi:hypothetical protein
MNEAELESLKKRIDVLETMESINSAFIGFINAYLRERPDYLPALKKVVELFLANELNNAGRTDEQIYAIQEFLYAQTGEHRKKT